MSAGQSVGWDPAPRQGWVAPRVAGEFPGLAIHSLEVDGRTGRTPEPVRRRLRELSDRFYGSQAIHMRERPIPWAYRVFYRHIGLDPDRERTPIERLVLERLRDGAFKQRGMPADAINIAIAETGVALRAFDAGRLHGVLGIRESGPGEALDGRPGELPVGSLVIADERAPAALLFGAAAEAVEVGPGTRRIAIAAIQVGGIPQVAVEEALWIASATLESA